MAVPPVGCRLPDRLPGLHRGENTPGQAGGQQACPERSRRGHLPGLGREHGRPQGAAGLVAVRKRGRQVLAGGVDRTPEPGVKDILIACVDGLKGFSDAINAVFPNTRIQLCIVHLVRNSVKYVPWKDYKAVTADLKLIYQSVTEAEALLALEQFSAHWDGKYPQISRSWRAHWHNLNTLFGYPEDIRKAIYTTNAIESLNSVIRKAVQKRKLFPTEDSAKKVVYLAIQEASQKWTIPIKNWKSALNRFMIEFEDRLQDYI